MKLNGLEAVYEELNNMTEKEVYTFVVVLPKYKNKISVRWIFSYKRDSVKLGVWIKDY